MAIAATAVLATSASAQVTTQAQYVDEVNPICKDFRGDAKRAQRKAGGGGDPVAVFIRKTVAFQRVFKRFLRKVGRVEPPAEIADRVDDWVDGLRRQKVLTDRFIAAAKRRDALASVRLGKKVGKVQGQSGKRAKALDLDRCTQ